MTLEEEPTGDEASAPSDLPTDVFFEFAVEIADGERWELLRADGWEEMQARLAEVMGDIPVRRRQALMMLLFSMVEELVTPDQVKTWMALNDVSSEAGVEELIGWLRRVRRGEA